MPISWDVSMDRKLFLAIMKVHNISVDAPAVAALLSTDTEPCTAIAVRRRLQRINEQIKKDDAINESVEIASPNAKSTPEKRSATAGDAVTPRKKFKTQNSKKSLGREEGSNQTECIKYERVKKEPLSEVDESE